MLALTRTLTRSASGLFRSVVNYDTANAGCEKRVRCSGFTLWGLRFKVQGVPLGVCASGHGFSSDRMFSAMKVIVNIVVWHSKMELVGFGVIR